jgi:hypothetical protein
MINLKEAYFFILYLLYWVILGIIDTNSLIYKLFNIFNIIVILPFLKDSWFVFLIKTKFIL